MKPVELARLTHIARDHVTTYGVGAARIYCAVVELDGQVALWRKRAYDLGWCEPPVEEVVDNSIGI